MSKNRTGHRVSGVVVKNANKKFSLNEPLIKRIGVEILEILGKPRDTKLDIVFLSDKAIKPVNKKYKHSDRATDVLSFDLGECGQILISSDTALKNSKVFGTLFEEEIILYVIHGILHLFGYDDETAREKKKMSAKENRILKILCAKSSFSKVLTPR
ncbi:MAG: rRNA maturation RNase YbeY [Candidatus Omnitrophota bacterium]|nr:rRNA maturation RNase YbeY [Candidatus Omnitrophota bacterium]